MADDPAPHFSRPRHEPADVTLRPVVAVGMGVGIVVVALAVLADVLFPQRALDMLLRPPLPPMTSPALQSDPPADMAAFRAADLARLTGFGWVDRKGGVAHVPIDQAMRQMARDGIPGWPAAGTGRP
ncbi:hypothetical protein JUN65_19210 [Gluconacetobacter azotocaptans]|uniref:hypothetical protein n=1 Tax=Gluconacetobacter azotocaptans TaxID=142834 RepID=UPI001956D503|nr:hypothetical protein [Gluconacetobacter azotocaptans]MBM9403701.1 hypothetical protein [Gluconacetobacter azotocaptans]